MVIRFCASSMKILRFVGFVDVRPIHHRAKQFFTLTKATVLHRHFRDFADGPFADPGVFLREGQLQRLHGSNSCEGMDHRAIEHGPLLRRSRFYPGHGHVAVRHDPSFKCIPRPISSIRAVRVQGVYYGVRSRDGPDALQQQLPLVPMLASLKSGLPRKRIQHSPPILRRDPPQDVAKLAESLQAIGLPQKIERERPGHHPPTEPGARRRRSRAHLLAVLHHSICWSFAFPFEGAARSCSEHSGGAGGIRREKTDPAKKRHNY
jgi:hypothetical protein